MEILLSMQEKQLSHTWLQVLERLGKWIYQLKAIAMIS